MSSSENLHFNWVQCRLILLQCHMRFTWWRSPLRLQGDIWLMTGHVQSMTPTSPAVGTKYFCAVSVRLIDACDQESHIQLQPHHSVTDTLNQYCCRLALLSLSLTIWWETSIFLCSPRPYPEKITQQLAHFSHQSRSSSFNRQLVRRSNNLKRPRCS